MEQNNFFSFQINTIGESTGKQYSGNFVYQRPTIGKKRDICKEEAILNSDYKDIVNYEIIAINAAIAFLKVTLLECPEWFKECKYGLDLEDENIFELISKNIKEFEDNRTEKIKKILETKPENNGK